METRIINEINRINILMGNNKKPILIETKLPLSKTMDEWISALTPAGRRSIDDWASATAKSADEIRIADEITQWASSKGAVKLSDAANARIYDFLITNESSPEFANMVAVGIKDNLVKRLKKEFKKRILEEPDRLPDGLKGMDVDDVDSLSSDQVLKIVANSSEKYKNSKEFIEAVTGAYNPVLVPEGTDINRTSAMLRALDEELGLADEFKFADADGNLRNFEFDDNFYSALNRTGDDVADVTGDATKKADDVAGDATKKADDVAGDATKKADEINFDELDVITDDDIAPGAGLIKYTKNGRRVVSGPDGTLYAYPLGDPKNQVQKLTKKEPKRLTGAESEKGGLKIPENTSRKDLAKEYGRSTTQRIARFMENREGINSIGELVAKIESDPKLLRWFKKQWRAFAHRIRAIWFKDVPVIENRVIENLVLLQEAINTSNRKSETALRIAIKDDMELIIKYYDEVSEEIASWTKQALTEAGILDEVEINKIVDTMIKLGPDDVYGSWFVRTFDEGWKEGAENRRNFWSSINQLTIGKVLRGVKKFRGKDLTRRGGGGELGRLTQKERDQFRLYFFTGQNDAKFLESFGELFRGNLSAFGTQGVKYLGGYVRRAVLTNGIITAVKCFASMANPSYGDNILSKFSNYEWERTPQGEQEALVKTLGNILNQCGKVALENVNIATFFNTIPFVIILDEFIIPIIQFVNSEKYEIFMRELDRQFVEVIKEFEEYGDLYDYITNNDNYTSLDVSEKLKILNLIELGDPPCVHCKTKAQLHPCEKLIDDAKKVNDYYRKSEWCMVFEENPSGEDINVYNLDDFLFKNRCIKKD